MLKLKNDGRQELLMSIFEPEISVTIPINLVSEMNVRDHYFKKYKRAKSQKDLAYISLVSKIKALWNTTENHNIKFKVTLTRIMGARQRKFDGDNLQSSFKAVRDGVAKALWIDDGNNRIKWEYFQEKGKKAEINIKVTEII